MAIIKIVSAVCLIVGQLIAPIIGQGYLTTQNSQASQTYQNNGYFSPYYPINQGFIGSINGPNQVECIFGNLINQIALLTQPLIYNPGLNFQQHAPSNTIASTQTLPGFYDSGASFFHYRTKSTI